MQRQTGLPDKVSRYDPIEFLQLSKISTAFLDLGLEEQKGGVGNQLLCGHLVGFIQENGLNAVERLPRFKQEYLEEILTKCKEKGIDFELKDNPFEGLNFEKINKPEISCSINPKPTDMGKEEKNLIKQRKFFIEQTVSFLQQNGYSTVSMLTKRVSATANNFSISVPEKDFSNIEKLLKSKKELESFYHGNQCATVSYPDKLLVKKENLKPLIKACKKERTEIVKILKNKGYLHKEGGTDAKSKGSISCSNGMSIAKSMILKITIHNKSKDTLNPVFLIIHRHYEKAQKDGLITLSSFGDEKDCWIEIKYEFSYFKIPKIEQIQPDTPVIKEEPVPEKLIVNEELHVILETAEEADDSLQKQIDELHNKKKENKLELVKSVSGLFLQIIWEILGEDKYKIFEDNKSEAGLQTLTQVSTENIKESISLKVLQRLGLKE